MTKTKIIVVQTFQDCFEPFQEMLGKNQDLELYCFSIPAEALKFIASKGGDVLITGQCFYGSPFKTTRDPDHLLKMLRSVCDDDYAIKRYQEDERLYEGINDGNDLAERARILNQEIITLRYSMTPEKPDHLCGEMDKWLNKLEAIEVLGSEKFLGALEQKDKTMLPSSKGVRWYLENFPDSWKNGGN